MRAIGAEQDVDVHSAPRQPCRRKQAIATIVSGTDQNNDASTGHTAAPLSKVANHSQLDCAGRHRHEWLPHREQWLLSLPHLRCGVGGDHARRWVAIGLGHGTSSV